MRERDFCKQPPAELSRGRGRPTLLRGRGTGVPDATGCFCPTYSLAPRLADTQGFGRRVPAGGLPGLPRVPWGPCLSGAGYITYQCAPALLAAPPIAPPARAAAPGLWRWRHTSEHSVSAASAAPAPAKQALPPVDVLLAVTDHYGHGLFALVQRVLNQVHLARRLGLEPAVFVGPRTWMEPQACEYGAVPYFDAGSGGNVWEYWFLQPGNYSLGARTVRSRPVGSVQVLTVEQVADQPVRAYHAQHALLGLSRRTAHAMLGEGGARLVRREMRERAERIFAAWRGRSKHIIGVHVRGTDKVVRPKVPPEAYFPLLDLYLAAHGDGLVFVATDDVKYMARLRARYGGADGGRGSRLVSLGGGYREAGWGGRSELAAADASAAAGTRGRGQGGYARGEEVLIDALLLARCDFLLKSTSAVAEFALWVSASLSRRHLDLQLAAAEPDPRDRFAGQELPPWAARGASQQSVPRRGRGVLRAGGRLAGSARGGGSGVAAASSRERAALSAAFCSALAAGCANDTIVNRAGSEYGTRFYGGKYCARCPGE